MSIADRLDALGRFIVRGKLPAALLLLAMTIAASIGVLSRVDEGPPIDFTPQALFNGDDTNERALALREWWGKDDNEVMVLVEGPIFTPEGAALMQSLHAALAADPDVERVDSLVSLGIAARGEDGVSVKPLLREGMDAAALSLAAARAASEPGLVGAAVSPDGGAATLRARLGDDLERVAQLSPAVNRLRDITAAAETPGFSIGATGIPEIRLQIVEQLIRDQLRYLPADAVIFAAVLGLLFRGFVPGLLPLFTVGLAVVWATGLLLGLGVTFNVLSILIPALVLVIGISDGIHLLTRYREELSVDRDREAAMGRTLRHLASACFLTSFTTAVGFGSLAVSHSQALQEFGVQSAAAVMVAFGAVVIGLPTMLAWVPAERVIRARGTEAGKGRLHRGLMALDAAVAARPGRALGASALFTACAVWIASGVGTDSHMMELFPDDHEVVRIYSAVVEHGGGVVPVYAHLEADRPGAFREPEILAKIDALEAVIASREEIRWTASTAGVLRGVHRALTGEDAVPDDEALIEQELFVLELGGDQGRLDALVDPDWRVTRILGLSVDAGGHVFNELAEVIQAEGDALFEGTGVTVIPAGDGIVASAGIHRIIDDLFASVGIAFGIIGVTLLLMLRSARLAALSMVPNVLPLIITLATLGVIGADIQTGNVVSFAVALGLAVDDTIHFLARYREELASGKALPEAVRATFAGAGPALVYTTLLLMAGFSVLAFSSLTPTWHFGVLAVSTLLAALGADLVVLPALLHLLDRRSLSR